MLAPILVAALLQTQELPRIPVYVTRSGDDLIGGQLVYAIKEKLRQSSRFTPVNTPGMGNSSADFHIDVITGDFFGSKRTQAGHWTAASVVLLHNLGGSSVYLAHFLVVTDSEGVHSYALNIVVKLDEKLDAALEDLRSVMGLGEDALRITCDEAFATALRLHACATPP